MSWKKALKKELFFSIWVWIGVGTVHGASTWKDTRATYADLSTVVACTKSVCFADAVRNDRQKSGKTMALNFFCF